LPTDGLSKVPDFGFISTKLINYFACVFVCASEMGREKA